MAEAPVYKNLLPIKVGIICGVGYFNQKLLFAPKEIEVSTIYGKPSDALLEGTIQDYTCVLLARHGRRDNISPSCVNYRANIWALKEIGCTHIISIYDCSSLSKGLRRGEFVVPHDIIDLTNARSNTFYDGDERSPQGVMAMSLSPPFSLHFRHVMIDIMKSLAVPVHDDAIIVCTEGPHFPTRAECKLMAEWGGEIFNSCAMPEPVLAKEIGLLYMPIAAVTNHECWNENDYAFNKLNMHKLKHTYNQWLQTVIGRFITSIPRHNWDRELCIAKDIINDSKMPVPSRGLYTYKFLE
ncbi:S-methyl-5'-thioadenosine phosphorylase-like [Teleopsis dalmanni]|uniref:S-methyl-5'-thioadenosine phosphorylase-like n=1 Tax=Teleopsis dalmanni TaxID=139649 RepID=UPI0018CF0FC7|nr:S-methyl-5'-thioadenosine phosphorylase-like [Teleopsis dalmanni]